VEPALAVHEERELSRRDPVAFAALAILERELAVDRGETVVRGADRVDEPVAARILVVVQVALGALALGPGIERVDEHGRDRARARDLDPGLPELVGNRRNAPVPGIRRAHRRVAGHDVLVQRSPQDFGAPGAELERAGAERVVQEDQILAERRSEEPRGVFGRGELHARRVGCLHRPLTPVPKRLLFAWRPKGCQWQNGPRSIRPCEEARWPRCCSS